MRSASLLALLPLTLAGPARTRRDGLAPLVKPEGDGIIEGEYIVKFKDDVVSAQAVTDAVNGIKADADYVYDTVFRGFAASLTEVELEKLRQNEEVDYIEVNAENKIARYPTPLNQTDAPWGLSRLSSFKTNRSYYLYEPSAGAGTCAYVLDTGIDITHPDFEGRAFFAANFAGGNDTDVDGHGTHIAGTIGGRKFGVAKNTTLYSVKTLGDNGSAPTSSGIAGMDYVAKADHDCPRGSVVNLSWGRINLEGSTATNDAAAALVRAGNFVAAAAGNAAFPAQFFSPGSESTVCSVGATDKDDSYPDFNNFGPPTDILAPGVDILSAAPGGGSVEMSGTSMATAHVSGLAAYLLGRDRDVFGLCEYIASYALNGLVTGYPGVGEGLDVMTVNKIASNGLYIR